MTTIDPREILAILNDPAIADPADYLRRKLTDLISPTMADVEWDHAVHAGLCAEHPKHGLVRMMHEVEEGETIDCILPDMSLLVIHAEELAPIPGTRVDLAPRRHAEGWEA